MFLKKVGEIVEDFVRIFFSLRKFKLSWFEDLLGNVVNICNVVFIF